MYFVENLNFKPDEHSYVEQWVEPEDPSKAKEEEKKNDQPVVDLKKLTAADKKKYEEELKKKQEEELFKLQQKSPAEIEKELKRAQQKEEDTRNRLLAEHFDYKTTYNYLQNLQKFGQIYVNDAPLASLSTSNSVAELNFN